MKAADIERMRVEYAKGFTATQLDSVKPIVPFLRDTVSPVLTEKIDGLLTTRKGNYFKRIKRSKNAGETFTPICVYPIYKNKDGWNLLYSSRIPIWYALATSQIDATLCIDRAEGVFKRGVRGEILHAFNGEIPEDVQDVEQRFQRYNEMLIKDPTGVSLVESQILRATRYLLNFPTQNHPYGDIMQSTHLLACMYTAALYRTIYPLSE